MPTPKEEALAKLYDQLSQPGVTSEQFETLMSRIQRLEAERPEG
jgi:hypothetical protein